MLFAEEFRTEHGIAREAEILRNIDDAHELPGRPPVWVCWARTWVVEKRPAQLADEHGMWRY